MEYVRYKNSRWFQNPNFDFQLVINSVYTFPKIIDEQNNIRYLNINKVIWNQEFQFIDKTEFLLELNMEESKLQFIEELLESNDKDNHKMAALIFNKHKQEMKEKTSLDK